MEFLYRTTATRYAPPADEFGEYRGEGRTEVSTSKFPVVKTTAKGVWIDFYGTRKFINLSSRKKFACETKEQAMESFKARKASQIKILSAQLEQAKKQLSIATFGTEYVDVFDLT